DHAAHGTEKIDLGEAWTKALGLPFVYAFWAGWPRAVTPEDAAALQHARDAGVAHVDEVARQYYPEDRTKQDIAGRYLRDNIQYALGGAEYGGLRTFYVYAGELGLVPAFDGKTHWYHADDPELADRVCAGQRVNGDEALELYRSAPTPLLGRLADAVRARKHPDNVVSYIIDRN